MSKPYGYYFDKASSPLRTLNAVQDWLFCVAFVAVLAGLVGWMVSIWPVVWLFFPDFDGSQNFGLVYLISVGVWVVPSSAWSAVSVRKAAKRCVYNRD